MDRIKLILNSKLLLVLFIISIILIPFDNLPYFSNILGELSVKGSAYVFGIITIIIFLQIIINKEKIRLKGFWFINIYLIWIFISFLINSNNILSNTFKGRTGINKFILQIAVLLFLIIIMYSSLYIIEKYGLNILKIRKYIVMSFILVGIYALLEFINLTHLLNLDFIINKISWLVHSYSRGIPYTKGIRSVTGEPSYYGMYSAFVFPWLFSYVYTEKDSRKKLLYILINLIFLLFIIFTKSRIAYFIIFFQLFLYTIGVLVFKNNKKSKKVAVLSIGLIIISFALINNTIFNKIGGDANSIKGIGLKKIYSSLTDSNNMSNVARFGLQSAAINMGKNNFIFGVGLGQFGFYVNKYIGNNALKSSEVLNWINPNTKVWPPAFMLYSRIIGEEGFIGFFIFLFGIVYILIKSIKKLMYSKDDILGLSLIISFVGILLSGLNADSYANIQFWITIAIIKNYLNYNHSSL